MILIFQLDFLNYHIYKVLSSAKLHTSVSKVKKSKSLRYILNNNGPKIDPCGTP